MKRNWPKIIIVLIAILITAGSVTPLFGNVVTELFSSPSQTAAWKAPDGNLSAMLDHSGSIPPERGKSNAAREFGSFILLGTGMMTLASWGKRKLKR